MAKNVRVTFFPFNNVWKIMKVPRLPWLRSIGQPVHTGTPIFGFPAHRIWKPFADKQSKLHRKLK